MTTTPAHPVMNFYGFIRMPFGKDFESAEAFCSPSLANTVAMLSLSVECEDILLISGPIGSGKSVALRSFIAALDPNRFSPIYLFYVKRNSRNSPTMLPGKRHGKFPDFTIGFSPVDHMYGGGGLLPGAAIAPPRRILPDMGGKSRH